MATKEGHREVTVAPNSSLSRASAALKSSNWPPRRRGGSTAKSSTATTAQYCHDGEGEDARRRDSCEAPVD